MSFNKAILLGITLASAISCAHLSEKSDAQDRKPEWIPPLTTQIPFGSGIEAVSERFIGAPFVDNSLGEGPGHHDSDPTSRLDAFDCTTFVESVWTMAFSVDRGERWANELQKIRYRNGDIAFPERLHFITTDWMPYHEKRGAIVNVTSDLGIPLAESITTIDRTAWYQKMHPAELSDFERRYPAEKPTVVTTKYLTFKELLDNPEGIPRLRQELQKGVLLANFIRPNWDTVKYIGTRIDVSHQGFLIAKGDKIILRHASAVLGKVGDEDFIEYMKAYKNHATLKGIQLARIKSL
ncbi:MAG TPA: N-acetylmuramoyl-L-alanine amidase-like domain-containing protein [Allocoleopsis sp.]